MFQIHTECIITESMSVCVKIVIKIEIEKNKKIVIVFFGPYRTALLWTDVLSMLYTTTLKGCSPAACYDS